MWGFLGLLYNEICLESRRRKYYWVRPCKTNTSELGAKATIMGCSSCLSYKHHFSWDVGCHSDGGGVTLVLEGNRKCVIFCGFSSHCHASFTCPFPSSLPGQPPTVIGFLATLFPHIPTQGLISRCFFTD